MLNISLAPFDSTGCHRQCQTGDYLRYYKLFSIMLMV